MVVPCVNRLISNPPPENPVPPTLIVFPSAMLADAAVLYPIVIPTPLVEFTIILPLNRVAGAISANPIDDVPVFVSVTSVLNVSATVAAVTKSALLELTRVVRPLNIFPPFPKLLAPPFFSRQVVLLYVQSFRQICGVRKSTSPLKVEKGPRYRIPLPVKTKLCAVVPTWVKYLSKSLPAEKPVPPTLIVFPLAKVDEIDDPGPFPKVIPALAVPLVELTMIFPLYRFPSVLSDMAIQAEPVFVSVKSA